ncbi:GH1 family beta-glucosidase [Sedimentisphaera salicampi]|uniref:Beta-glucosidase n=1 Tax=Sedimentisphaera salicampi TaxID=1941349 RepID=A0A1W6LLR4_9BACT|nr:GH1 family beta-glucosidase [Sedimentisphaera salicampi]ARN56692.1 Beta-glucosidase A [Sedimentisphaera salicampi]
MENTKKFPANFVWGTATASYQIEGARSQDGKGDSVWDMFCNKPDAIWENQKGDVACDHYNRYKEDVALMHQLGYKSYRFSISWPRVFPEGTGMLNEKGISFYERLVDELLAKDIEPYITLFHWDYPYELYRRGGWLNPQSPDWFAEYAKAVVERLSDRVSNWITMNEPQIFLGKGHLDGINAPGDKLGFAQFLQAAHNTLVAHGKAVQVIRSFAKKTPNVGYAPVGIIKIPSTNSKEDIEAARQAMFSVEEIGYWNNSWWTDPVLTGRYPEDGVKTFEEYLPDIDLKDMEIISQDIDFLGLNIYNGRETEMGPDSKPQPAEREMGYGLTSFDWPVTPSCLYWGPKFFYEKYNKPIYITENGMANNDWVMLDGKVHDTQRIDFLKRYILELHRAIEEGVDIRGYFLWSLMDNFEWAEGVKQRLGLIYTDYTTLQRIPKDSAYWYKELIETNGESLFK